MCPLSKSETLYAEVVLPLPVDRTFTYRVPEELRGKVEAGMRAAVPVVKRIETGYITCLTPHCAIEAPKDLLSLPDEEAVFSPALLKLCRWVADYYCCSWGEALQCAVPAGIRLGTKMRYRLLDGALEGGRYSERQKRIIAALYKHGPLPQGRLAREVGGKTLASTLQALLRRGVISAEAMPREGAHVRTETYVSVVEDAVPDAEFLAAMQRRAPKQAAFYLDLLHTNEAQAAAALHAKHGTNASIVRALESKGLIARDERECYRRPELAADPKGAEKHQLNAEQQAAHDAITGALEARAFQTFLLHGITGSGKTEVYLQTIERVLELGRGAIILVPEISLTPQTVGRFFARFGQDIAVLHSGLSAGERYDEWRRARRGEVHIVVGARSAIFAPLPDVGIIVVDEEHDHSYKQGDTPRYHARDVAIMRAQMAGAVCVLGSATPSIESSYNAGAGKSLRLNLRERATSAKLPEVRLIDMRIESAETKGQIVLSRTLEEAVLERVHAKEQVILLLNRRGHSPFVLCPMCGWSAECDDCNVSLTYHRAGAHLRCHYCGAQHPKPQVCGKCHFNPLIYLGTGTQKGEDYLMRAFPSARIERMDADTTSGRGGHAKILTRFAKHEIDILIGTQMLAKGHDYPRVTLVGVINADTGLALPDFRAAENVFQLLTQVAGRAGRGDKPGLVYIQTFRPKHYAVTAAAAHDYDAFFAHEIAQRRDAGYPPFRRMADLAVEDEDPMHAERHAVRLHHCVRAAIDSLGLAGVQILGPSPATIRRVKKQYRWRLGLLSRSAKRLNLLTRHVRDEFQKNPETRKIRLRIDLDPHGMY